VVRVCREVRRQSGNWNDGGRHSAKDHPGRADLLVLWDDIVRRLGRNDASSKPRPTGVRYLPGNGSPDRRLGVGNALECAGRPPDRGRRTQQDAQGEVAPVLDGVLPIQHVTPSDVSVLGSMLGFVLVQVELLVCPSKVEIDDGGCNRSSCRVISMQK